MDPLAVIRTIWRYKVFVLPAMVITLIAVVYVFQFGPRYFESSMSYAMVNPKLPTDKELDKNPELGGLNRDNPFLRSSDPSLITEVLIARLSSSDASGALESKGLSTDYSVSKGINGNGFVVSITGNGESEDQALATTRALGVLLEEELETVQKVNGADDRFLFTALVVTSPDEATEQFSSRLRSVIMVFLGGTVLTFGAVSLARSLDAGRARKRALRGSVAEDGASKKPEGYWPSSTVPAFQPKASSRPQAAAPMSRRTARTSRPAPREESLHASEPARR
jgi:hypothetical protein